MKIGERIDAFAQLGKELDRVLKNEAQTTAGKKLSELIPTFYLAHGWYTEKNLRHRLSVLSQGLKRDVLQQWISDYQLKENSSPQKVAVILAANIPLAGFDDFRCVLMSGNVFIGKLSSDDKVLLPLLAEMLKEISPSFSDTIFFEEGRLQHINAVIATGSNNSGRYFDHYFSKYPHIIRRNRNGIAVLSGNETPEELRKLGDDIFLYFGLGCRSVSKLFVPSGYDFKLFFEAMVGWGDEAMMNKKYMNNYEYNKTVYLMGKNALLDNNFLLLKEDEKISSPPGVLFYEHYFSKQKLAGKLSNDRPKIQCIVANDKTISSAVPFGHAQFTLPSDYADHMDVMNFLAGLQ